MVKRSGDEEQISVAEATRRVIRCKPSIMDCLKYEIVNYSALAQLICPEVKKICKKEKIKPDSIKMSLMRFADTLKSEHHLLEKSVVDILSESRLQLRNDLSVITARIHNVFARLGELSRAARKFSFFQLIQGSEVFTIITDQSHKMDIIAILTGTAVVDSLDNQSAIIIVSPGEIINVKGVIAYITDLLAVNDINITQIMSCYTDTIILVNRKDAMNAFKLIEDRIYLLRKIAEERRRN